MKKVLIPLADGFEEIETVTLIDVLRRAGIDVCVAGVKAGELKGSRRIRLVSDCVLDEVMDQTFDMMILPGGTVGVDNLSADQRVIDILKRMKKEDRMIGAICAAPMALKAAGLEPCDIEPATSVSLVRLRDPDDNLIVLAQPGGV